ncbi:MAG TPA: hypothetical protein VGB31_01495 [Myxococcota bacterium]
MSKLRQNVAMETGELAAPEEGDLRGFVIFTQLRTDGPFIYAGWLDAPDPEMALVLAKEHYGRDQECTAIWAAPREFVGGLRENAETATEEVASPREYRIFTQHEAGDQYVSSILVTETSAANAIERAKREIPGASELNHFWAIPCAEIASTERGEVIWRSTDQTYRLARGYSKDVREKWEKIRADRDIREYEKDDLKETF